MAKIDKELVEFYKECLKNAKKGDPEAQYDLGRCYADNIGVKEHKGNKKEAIKWFEKAAENGYDNACWKIGSILESSADRKDLEKAAKYYLMGINKGGTYYSSLADVLYKLYANHNAANVLECIKWYKSAADNGEEYSCRKMLDFYRRNKHISYDWPRIIKYNETLAGLADADAAHRLYRYYEDGNVFFLGGPFDSGKKSDYEKNINGEKAFEFLVIAAKCGNSDAECELGVRYHDGSNGLKKDHKIAMQWYMRSAAKGNSRAAERIGMAYQCGWGVEVNIAKANEWYEKSLALKGVKSSHDVSETFKQMFWEDNEPNDEWIIMPISDGTGI